MSFYRTVSVASHVFTINDCLTLVQVSWYPSSPNTLALLTSDNFLQLFNLAEPELPVLKVPLLPSSTGIQLHHHHGLNMDQDCVVGFSLWNRSAFILQDSQDVALSLISLTQHPHPLPKPLRIYPPADDNYWSTPSSLLVLNTTPLAVVVADKTGMVYHCVYLEEESADHEVFVLTLAMSCYSGASRHSKRGQTSQSKVHKKRDLQKRTTSLQRTTGWVPSVSVIRRLHYISVGI